MTNRDWAWFWNKTKRAQSGCLEWQGYIDGRSGYGQSSYLGTTMHTHRIAWRIANGEPRPGMFVCHRCDNRKCCNPDHLFLGTHDDNMRDMCMKGRQQRVTGINASNGRLTAEQVAEIRRRFCPAPKPGRGHKSNAAELAAEFGITRQYVSQIARKVWRAVD